MDISAISAAASAQSDVASRKLADDFDTFLQLLTTQLQNQDPLEPLDSNEFTQQLVQFTSVEQLIEQNKNFETLISLLNGQRDADAVGYLGKQVMIDSDEAFHSGDGATWLYELNGTAATSEIRILSQSGNVVFKADGMPDAGLHEFQWDGKDRFGNDLPPGIYRFEVVAESASGGGINHSIFARGIVREIERQDGEPMLVLNGLLHPLSAVVAVSEPSDAT